MQVTLDPPSGLVRGGNDPPSGGGELGTTPFERARHGVEGALECTDLADRALWHARPEVAVRKAAGHDRCPADRQDDLAREVSREDEDEHDRSRETADPGDDRTASGRVGAILTRGGEAALDRHEVVELDPHRVDEALAFEGRRRGPRERLASARGSNERHRVVLDVGHAGYRDPLRGAELFGIVRDELAERLGLLREGGPGGLPGLQEALVAGDDVPAKAGLGVDDEPLEPVRGRQHLLGMPRAIRRLAEIGDREQQHREGGGDDERQQAARDDHATGQPSLHVGLPFACVATRHRRRAKADP